MSIMNQDLIVVLVGYVRRQLTLYRLKEWVAREIWDLASSPSPLDRMVLGELEIKLAEFDRGESSETDLRRHIKFLLALPNPELVPRIHQMMNRR